MLQLTPKIIAKAYLIAILILGMMVSPLPQFILATALLALQLSTAYKPPTPKINTALLLGTLVFTPLTLTPLTGSILSSLFIIPAVYLLDQSLRENAQNQPFQPPKKAREATLLLKSASVALITILIVALGLINLEIVSAAMILIVYFVTIVSFNLRRVPKKPFKENKTWSRILVGKTEKKQMQLSALTNLPLYTTITPLQPWVQVKPSNLTVTKNQTEVNLTFTPPLAGPTKIKLQTTTVDPWGLIQTNQTLEPIDLHIIPKAKYAQWLAKKYLEQTACGTASTAAPSPPRAFKAAKQGVEYYGGRLYQPGDRLKDVDWKHTFRLNELIIKEFAGAHGQSIIIVADLTAKDALDADKLAYNMVMAALTATTESLPSGLACFNQKEVLVAIAPMNPRATLKKTIRITEKITIVPQLFRLMQPTDIHELKKTEAEPSERFKEILEFEYEAIKTATKMYPATQALTKCVERTPAPAMITVTSVPSGDSDVLILLLEKLKKKGYNIVTV